MDALPFYVVWLSCHFGLKWCCCVYVSRRESQVPVNMLHKL